MVEKNVKTIDSIIVDYQKIHRNIKQSLELLRRGL